MAVTDALENKLCDLTHVPEDLDALPLVHVGGLHDPYVLLAVFVGHSFLSRAPSLDFHVSMHKMVNLVVVVTTGDEKRGRS